MNYYIEDFTLERYKEFLSEAKKDYSFADFSNQPSAKKHILLRHDLDLSVAAAYKVALTEYELGIRSTYFLLIHSKFYNLFESENSHLVSEIIKMGHSIGLHFDSHYYNINTETELDNYIQKESRFLAEIFNIDIKVFSFHLTNDFTMSCKKLTYGGLINAYADFFKSEYSYCSDSYGIWRFNRLFDFIKQNQSRNLQILTHPEWWIHQPLMPNDRIENIISDIITGLRNDANKNYIYKPLE